MPTTTALDAPAKAPPAPESAHADDAARTIGGYLKCMRSRIKRTGRGEQNAEMLLVSRTDGVLSIEDYGGWAERNASMAAMVRELDASGALGDFAPALVQTGDRCVARRGADGAVELHLWQRQPVPDELRARLPLRRVLSMCATPRYADVPVPDWCFDAWPAAGVAAGGFDDACAALAAAGAAAPADLRLGWHGTAHHHPSRLRLLELAAAHPDRLACFDVVGAEAAGGGAAEAAHRTLLEQVASYAYLLDVQGKGYSSRLKLLLHAGRPLFIARRPWEEYYMAALVPWTHYVPVAENLGDLVERVAWADAHPAEAAAIAAAAQQFAREHLTRAAAMRALAHALVSGTRPPVGGGGGGAVAAAAEAEAEAKAPSLTDIRFYCPAPGPPRAFPQAAFQGDAADEQAGNIAMDLSDWSPLAEPSSPDLGGEAPPELLLSPQQMPVFPPPRRIGGEVTPPVVNAEPRHLERQYSRSPLHHDADAVMCEA